MVYQNIGSFLCECCGRAVTVIMSLNRMDFNLDYEAFLSQSEKWR